MRFPWGAIGWAGAVWHPLPGFRFVWFDRFSFLSKKLWSGKRFQMKCGMKIPVFQMMSIEIFVIVSCFKSPLRSHSGGPGRGPDKETRLSPYTITYRAEYRMTHTRWFGVQIFLSPFKVPCGASGSGRYRPYPKIRFRRCGPLPLGAGERSSGTNPRSSDCCRNPVIRSRNFYSFGNGSCSSAPTVMLLRINKKGTQ